MTTLTTAPQTTAIRHGYTDACGNPILPQGLPSVAICGAPRAGKSEAQMLLQHLYGIVPIDDALPFRRATMEAYGLSWEMVSTQSGKDSIVDVCGSPWEVRTLIGRTGEDYEARHGTDFKAWRALRKARLEFPGMPASFGSARLSQPLFYKKAGCVVVEVVSPGCECVNAFDQYDRSAVDVVIHNDKALGLAGLEQQLREHLEPWLLAAAQDLPQP